MRPCLVALEEKRNKARERLENGEMVELAEDEMKNFGKICLSVSVSLGYCYMVGKITPKGSKRLLSVLPVIISFLLLPLNLTSIHLCGITSFLISWLANFKLLLFAFGKPPLCSDPSISFPRFLALTCLPIKIQRLPHEDAHSLGSNPIPNHLSDSEPYSSLQNSKQSQNKQKLNSKPQPKPYPTLKTFKDAQNFLWKYIVKGISFTSILRLNDYRDCIPQKLLWIIYLVYIYLALDTILTCIASAAKHTLGLSLESQFKQPLLCTSLQDFWGNRWNLMATNILKSTIYQPTKDISSRILGRQMATYTAVMVTFLVSAMMHELIFYYIGRLSPTFEVTWYFLLQGLYVCLEIAVKKYVGGTSVLPQWVSRAAALSFEVTTVFWLFLPPLLRTGLESRALQDYAAIYKSIRSVISTFWRNEVSL